MAATDFPALVCVFVGAKLLVGGDQAYKLAKMVAQFGDNGLLAACIALDFGGDFHVYFP